MAFILPKLSSHRNSNPAEAMTILPRQSMSQTRSAFSSQVPWNSIHVRWESTKWHVYILAYYWWIDMRDKTVQRKWRLCQMSSSLQARQIMLRYLLFTVTICEILQSDNPLDITFLLDFWWYSIIFKLVKIDPKTNLDDDRETRPRPRPCQPRHSHR